MKRVALFVGMSILVPALASGQNPPRPPAPPPPAPAPVVQGVPPVPIVAPVPAPAPAPVVVAPTILDPFQIDEAVRAARLAGRVLDADELRMALQQAEMARAQSDMFRAQVAQTIDTRHIADDARRLASTTIWSPYDLQDQRFSLFSQESDGSYESGKNYLNQKQYEQAILRFDRTIAAKGARADGALYWKAFAQFKQSKTDDALATIAQLRRDYAQSRYLADARVLEAEVRKPKDLAAIEDDDLLLLAINGLMNSDPPKAIPLIEGVLGRASSLKVKQRALYVLALSDQAQAHQILLNYAKGTGNPDLQREAINYLAQRRNKQKTTSTDLLDIYNSTQDPAIKMAVLSALRATGASAPLVSVVNNTTAPMAIRQSALSNLTELVSPQEFWNLYQKETDRDLRLQMVSIFSSMGAVDQLNQIVKTEKEPTVRQRAIRSLGNQKAERTGTTLVDIYTAEQDRDTKLAVISALATQNNADGLVSVARKETSLEIRTSIVKRLADMAPRSKAAADYLAEIIKR